MAIEMTGQFATLLVEAMRQALFGWCIVGIKARETAKKEASVTTSWQVARNHGEAVLSWAEEKKYGPHNFL